MIIGIVGKPNCGKSTFFKATTLADVEIANYPFATIAPNKGAGHVRVKCADKIFDTKCNPRVGYCVDGNRFVPVEVIDVAGLVPGAHEGKGMGLEFLNDLNQADVLIHVIDVSGSTDAKGNPVDKGSYDPANDIRFLEEELDHWYLGIIKKNWEKFQRSVFEPGKIMVEALNKQFSGLGSKEEIISEILKNLDLYEKKPSAWSQEELELFCSALRKKTKPMIIAANKADVPGAFENFERIKKEFEDYKIVPCSAESELALREASKKNLINYLPGDKHFEIVGELNPAQTKGLQFIQELMKKLEGTGLQEVIDSAIFDVLQYIYIFPGGVNKLEDKDGNRLPDCFLLPKGSSALDFAYKVHTDLGKNFIRAINVKTKRTIGKETILEQGDVIEIIADK